MSYYDDTYDDGSADVYATTGGLIDSQGNIRGVFGGKMPAILLVALIAGLIVIPLILRRKR